MTTAVSPRRETRITIFHTVIKQYTPDEQSDRRKLFWMPFLRTANQEQPPTIEDLEGRLRRFFAPKIKRQLEELFPPMHSVPGSMEKASLVASIVASSRIIDYSSLELGLSLEPFEKILKLFDNNFDYFAAFLGSYVPVAFVESVFSGNFSPSWNSVINNLEYSIDPAPDFVPLVRAPDFGTQEKKSATSIDKARWTWILANTSLVVPSLLAAIYIFIFVGHLQVREASLVASYQKLVEFQQALVQSLSEKLQETKGVLAKSPAAPTNDPELGRKP